MRSPTCTIDASSFIALDHLDLLPRPSLLFSRVLLPKAVRKELFRRRATKDRLRAVLDSCAFVECCDDYDKGAVDILLIERATQGVEDRGEVDRTGPTLSIMVRCRRQHRITSRLGFMKCLQADFPKAKSEIVLASGMKLC